MHRLLLPICVCFGLALSSQDQTQVSKPAEDMHRPTAPSLTPKGLLIKSYLQGMQFTPDERAFLLTRLHEAALEIDPGLSLLWSEETFQLSFSLQPGWDRLVHQKNSVVTISKLEPARAMELFSSLDLPVESKDSLLPEDLRAHAAVTVFGRFWRNQGKRGLGVIRQNAVKLGETGQYPYLAMVPIIKDLAASDPVQANDIYNEAVAFYRKPSRFRDAQAKFARFVLDTEKVMPAPSRRAALQAVLDRFEADKSLPSRSELTVVANSSSANFTTDQPAFPVLLQLLPAFENLDPDWAKRLVEKYPALSISKTTPRIETAFVGSVPGSGKDRDLLRAQVLERSRLGQIKQRIADKDAQGATELAETLTIPEFRSSAFSLLAGLTFEAAPKEARERLLAAKKLIDEHELSASKVEALAELSAAAYQMGEEEIAAKAWQQAFDSGEELFRQEIESRPGTAAYVTQVYDTLTRLVDIGVRFSRELTLERLNEVRNEVLAANLNIDVATALNLSPNPGSASTSPPVKRP